MAVVDQIRVFLRVAELSSFTAAATSLGLAKASVSAAVQELEGQLGTRLLHRTTRRVSLTQDGELFLARAQDLVDDLDELTGLFSEEGGPLRGRLRVAVPIGVARDAIIPALPSLYAEHPQLEIELSVSDRYVDVVREGFDCVLRVGARADSSLIARPVGHYRMVHCASWGYLARFGTPRSPAELSGHRLIRYASTLGGPTGGFDYLDPATGEERTVPLPGVITVDNSEAYVAACLAGLGIIQVPVVGVQRQLASGELIELLPDHPPAPLPVTLLYPARRNLPRRVRVFMDWLTALLRPRMAEVEPTPAPKAKPRAKPRAKPEAKPAPEPAPQAKPKGKRRPSPKRRPKPEQRRDR